MPLRLAPFAMLLCLIPAAEVPAQAYPAKTVRMVVPFSAGSGSDVIARIVAGGMTEAFGQQVIVENRTGAAGNIGAEVAARAAPDGYTVLFANVGHAANVTLYPKLGYAILRDFAPVTQLGSSPAVVVVHPSLPVRSMGELVKLARARPGAINYASGGTGSPTYIGAELFKLQARIDLLHVPYRGGGEALTSVISGETSVYFAPLASTLPIVQQGRLRPLAVTGTRRMALLAELPTVAEAGFPGYESGFWHGLMVPARTPRETITVIRAAAVKALNDPAIVRRFNDLGYVPAGGQPEEFAAYLKSQIDMLAPVLRGLPAPAS